MQALRAGKHVLVEKPTALRTKEADELLAVADERDLLLATNLMQRYNPLADAVQGLLDRKPLGELIHGYFENYACDEQLTPEHWFWDRSKSGGIFIEHGVHFFDLFAGWLGPGRVEAAQVSSTAGHGHRGASSVHRALPRRCIGQFLSRFHASWPHGSPGIAAGV